MSRKDRDSKVPGTSNSAFFYHPRTENVRGGLAPGPRRQRGLPGSSYDLCLIDAATAPLTVELGQ